MANSATAPVFYGSPPWSRKSDHLRIAKVSGPLDCRLWRVIDEVRIGGYWIMITMKKGL